MRNGRTVYIVDDDASVRRSLERLLRSAGYQPACFASVEELLHGTVGAPACVIADVTLTGRSGLELGQALAERGHHVPLIMLTAHDTAEMRAAAKAGGAVAFFRKPVDDQALVDSIEWVLERA